MIYTNMFHLSFEKFIIFYEWFQYGKSLKTIENPLLENCDISVDCVYNF
jgi:hypothetical protein